MAHLHFYLSIVGDDVRSLYIFSELLRRAHWQSTLPCIRRTFTPIQFPKQLPETFVQRMKIWVSRNNGPAKRPSLSFFDQIGANGIGQDIKAKKQILAKAFRLRSSSCKT